MSLPRLLGRLVVVWGGFMLAAAAALAHPFGLSGFDAHTDGRDVRFVMALDATSLVDLVARQRPGQAPPDIAGLAQQRGLILEYFAAHFRLHNTDLPCALQPPGDLVVDQAAGKVRFEARFRCPTELGRLVIDSTLFLEEPTPHDLIGNFRHVRAFERYFFGKATRQVHIDVPALRQVMPAEIDTRAGVQLAEPPPGAFDARMRHAIKGVPVGDGDKAGPATGPAAGAGGWAFVRYGVQHIVGGLDHVLFIVLLLLASPRVRQVLLVVAAFTVAHALTLVLGAYGLVVVSPRLAEPLIAASIVYLAVVNLRTPAGHSRAPVAFGFGLVHGLGFAGALAQLGLAGAAGGDAQLVGIVAWFNLGAVLGQLCVVAPGLLLGCWLRRRPDFFARGFTLANVAIGLLGCTWVVLRVFG